MKKLFAVTNTATDEIVGYFDNKMKAKDERNALNAVHGDLRHVVSKGPDHGVWE